MPAKGMTLPFISYGGSSMIAVAFGMGLLLALTRRRPSRARMPPVLAPRSAGRDVAIRPDAAMRGLVLLAAGGTGGHLFPAEALARRARGRGVARRISPPTAAPRPTAQDFPARGDPYRPLGDHRAGRSARMAGGALSAWRAASSRPAR